MLIKVVVSGSNPKDWKVPHFMGLEQNQGDDIAGVVAKVGANVTEFKPGDRVAAFHEIGSLHGSYAEYAIAWQHTTFHIPAKTTFEEASTLPLAALTSAIGLYVDQRLPQPWTPAVDTTPLVVYGAASAVGAFAVQLAVRSNIHPIIGVAGSLAPWVEQLIDRSKGDTIVDYRGGDDATVAALKAAAGGLKVYHAFDAVSEKNSSLNLSKVLESSGTINTVMPWRDSEEFPTTVNHILTSVGRAHKDLKDVGFVYSRYLGRGLQEGWLKPQPQKIVPGGLAGIEESLNNLQSGKAHAIKYVFRIADTEGAGKDSL